MFHVKHRIITHLYLIRLIFIHIINLLIKNLSYLHYYKRTISLQLINFKDVSRETSLLDKLFFIIKESLYIFSFKSDEK